MIVSAIGFMPDNVNLICPSLLMVLGGVTLLIALRLNHAWGVVHASLRAEAIPQRSVRWPVLVAGVASLMLLAVRNGQQIVPLLYQWMNIHLQVMALVIGVSLLVVGAGGVHWHDVAGLWSRLVTHRRELLLVLVITTFAFVLRVYNLHDGVRAFMDEGPFMTAVVDMGQHPLNPVLPSMNRTASFTRLFAYFQLALSDMLGSNLAVFRLASTLFGTLTVTATYGLTRQLLDRQTAMAAGVLLAAFPPHLHMSRIGINNIADPLFGVLALLAFTLAVQTGRRVWYVLAGAMLGLLSYFYEGGELLYPALLALWAGWLALTNAAKLSWRGLLWLLIAALLVAAPVHYTSLTYQLPLFSRLDERNLGNDYWLSLLVAPDGLQHVLTFWRERLLPPLLHFVHAPDASLFYGGNTALILPWLVPLFLLGMFHALRRSRTVLLLLWLVLTVLGNSLIFFNNWTVRFVVVMPAVAILCAVGLRYTWPMLTANNAMRWFKPVLSVIALAQMAWYFGVHLPFYSQQIIELRRTYDVVFRTIDLPDDIVVYVNYEDHIQVPFTYSLLQYLDDEHEFHAKRFDSHDFSELSPEGHYAFFVDPLDSVTLTQLGTFCHLDGPYFANGGVPRERQYGLYWARPCR